MARCCHRDTNEEHSPFLDEIDVLPLEAQHFTYAKAGGGADGSDRSLAVGKDRKERTELFCREYLWNVLSFGADPHERVGFSCCPIQPQRIA
jgi:hypothetical protein